MNLHCILHGLGLINSAYLVVFPCGSVIENPPASARDTRDTGSIPGSGRAPREENGSTLLYSCVGNPMDRGDWWATVHGVPKELEIT